MGRSNIHNSPSGKPIEGVNDGDILLWQLTTRTWVPSAIPAQPLLGQLRFLVGPAGSGANYTDLDAAIADAEAQATLSGTRQTVFLLGGQTYTSAASPFVLPNSLNLVSIGGRAILDTGLSLSPTAGDEQLIKGLRTRGSTPAIAPFTATLVILDIPAGARLILDDIVSDPQLPLGATDAGLAIEDMNGGLLEVFNSVFTDSVAALGGIVFNPANDPSGTVELDNVVAVSTSASGGGLRLGGGAGTATIQLQGSDCQLFAADDALKIDGGTLDGQWEFTNSLAESSGAAISNSAIDATAAFSANGFLTWNGGQLRGTAILDPGISSQTLIKGGTDIRETAGGPTGPLVSGANFGGLNIFDNCNIDCDTIDDQAGSGVDGLVIKRSTVSLADTTLDLNGANTFDDNDFIFAALIGANPCLSLSATGTLNFTRNKINADPAATLIVSGPAGTTINTGENVIERGNAGWNTPATSYGGGLAINALVTV